VSARPFRLTAPPQTRDSQPPRNFRRIRHAPVRSCARFTAEGRTFLTARLAAKSGERSRPHRGMSVRSYGLRAFKDKPLLESANHHQVDVPGRGGVRRVGGLRARYERVFTA
jgi:hypothetical protein